MSGQSTQAPQGKSRKWEIRLHEHDSMVVTVAADRDLAAEWVAHASRKARRAADRLWNVGDGHAVDARLVIGVQKLPQRPRAPRGKRPIGFHPTTQG